MKTLYLLRHGKSAWDDPEAQDFDRPLAPRGARASTLIGRWIAANGPVPEAAVCSAAKRTVDTLALVAAQWDMSVPTETERRLYLCGVQTWYYRLPELPDTAATAIAVGHNPDMHDLVLGLAGDGDADALAEATRAYPTGALSVLALDLDRWADVRPGCGRLLHFVKPRDLE